MQSSTQERRPCTSYVQGYRRLVSKADDVAGEPCKGSSKYLSTFYCLPIFISMAGASAYATSQCYQWRDNTIDGWFADPSVACETIVSQWQAAMPEWTYGAAYFGYVSFPQIECRAPVDKHNGSVNQYNSTSIVYRSNPAGCQVYVSSSSEPVAQCGSSCNGVGDPINPATGGMLRSEADASSRTGLSDFKRFYNSTDSSASGLGAGWKGSFSRSIKPVYSSSAYRAYVSSSDNSSLYNDEATACVNGFAQIKSRVSNWASATSTYSNGACRLSVGTTSIGMLPIFYTSTPTPAPGSTVVISYDVTRDDGQVVRFSENSGSIVPPPSIAMRLQQTASGYTLTDTNDNVEMYDTSGKLLSVTSRAGVVQTISYDSSGRLSAVTDSFGHNFSLNYDAQGRVISASAP